MRALGLVLLAGCSRLFGFEEPAVAALDDAASDANQPPAGRCSTFHSFIDTFDDAVLGSQWEVQTAGGSITTSNGELHLQANGTTSFVALGTRAMYRFDEAAFTLQLPRIDPDSFTGADNKVLVFLRADQSFQFELTINNHLLTATRTGGVPPLVVGQVEYDPAASRFLRFERIAGNLHARDSSDGITFRTIGMVAEDVPVARAFVGIQRNPASPGALVLDIADVNAGVTPDRICSPLDFAESFDGELSPLQWETDLDQCLIELDGVLRINTGKAFQCSLTSAVPYDLRLGSFTVDVPPATNLSDGQLRIVLEIENTANPTFSISGSSLEVTFGGVLANAPYDPNAHRFFRFRAIDAVLQWETSADGVNFTMLATVGAVAGLGRARLAITVDSFDSGTDSGSVSIAGVNAP